ncbi:MAG: radical SAM protein [Elusimicrobiales bacterium]
MASFISAPIKFASNCAGRLKSSAESYLLRVSGKLPPVRWVTWEITEACNSKCRLCSIWKHGKRQDTLTLEEIKKVFSDPLFKNLEILLITGGEAALRDDLLDILLFISQKLPKARPTISTNALLPDRVLGVVDAILEKGLCIDVGVSLDGVGEHHDQIRGVPGNFQKVDYLLDKLIELKKKHGDRLSFVAGQTLHPITVDYIDETKKYAREKGVAHFMQLYDEAPYYHNMGDATIAERDMEKLAAKVRADQPSFHNETLLTILKNKIINFDCFTMRTFFILRSNGDIMPCLRLCDTKIGNVRDSSPSEIWNSKPAWDARRKVMDCKGCANTWATDWSCQSNSLPFARQLFSYFAKKHLKK